MKRIVATVVIVAFSYSLVAQGVQQVYYTNVKFLERITSVEKIKYRYAVYELPNHTYGYIIFANDHKYLHQANMPGKPEGIGFSSRAAATKVAELVVAKLDHPVVPPNVSTAEMQQLGVN